MKTILLLLYALFFGPLARGGVGHREVVPAIVVMRDGKLCIADEPPAAEVEP